LLNQQIQKHPTLIPALKRVTKIATGSNHALVLISNSSIFVWGSGKQNQLGQQILECTKLCSLVPREFGLFKNIINIGASSDYSFAIYKNSNVYSWGLNNFGQTGIVENTGENIAVTPVLTVVKSLKNYSRVTCIIEGNYYSIAVTDKDKYLVGNLDNDIV
jgi:regulator of chromosome condensation